MKNLKIKKTIWQTYKAEIKFMLFLSLALCIIYVLYLNAETIKMLFIEISDILDSLFSRIGNWFSVICNYIKSFLVYYFNVLYIYISIVIAIIFIVRYFIFIYRQQYIPLTQEEMEANNITDVYEYFSFISNLLLGHIPRRCLLNIKSSATILLSESQNIKNESQICWIKSELKAQAPFAENLKYTFRKVFRNNHKILYILKLCLKILFFINFTPLLIPMLIEYGILILQVVGIVIGVFFLFLVCIGI